MQTIMNTPHLILWMIGLCMAVMLLLLFAKPLRKALRWVARGAAGLCAVLVLNTAAASFGLMVGINLLTMAVAVVLGVPGVVMLYAAQIFL